MILIKNINFRQWIFIVLAVLWMGVIFWFSSMKADESTRQSYTVGYILGNIFVDDFSKLDIKQQEEYAAGMDHLIRKTAHAMEYMILAVLLFWCFKDDSKALKNTVFHKLMNRKGGAWGIATLYACTDEFHQMFVPGRACRLADVCIDSAGAFAGVQVCMVIAWLLRSVLT